MTDSFRTNTRITESIKMVQGHTQGQSTLGTTRTWARFRTELNRTRTSRASKGSRNNRTTTFPPGFNPHHLRRTRTGLERVLIPQMPCPLSTTSPAQWRPDWLISETGSDVGEIRNVEMKSG